jgi:hypothetical protein
MSSDTQNVSLRAYGYPDGTFDLRPGFVEGAIGNRGDAQTRLSEGLARRTIFRACASSIRGWIRGPPLPVALPAYASHIIAPSNFPAFVHNPRHDEEARREHDTRCGRYMRSMQHRPFNSFDDGPAPDLPSLPANYHYQAIAIATRNFL